MLVTLNHFSRLAIWGEGYWYGSGQVDLHGKTVYTFRHRGDLHFQPYFLLPAPACEVITLDSERQAMRLWVQGLWG